MFGRLLSYIKTMGTGSMRKRLYTRLVGGAVLLVLMVVVIAQAQRISAERRAAVAAQLDHEPRDEDGGLSNEPRLSRTPQPIPKTTSDDASPSSLKPPSTISFADAPRAPASYSLDDEDESSGIRYGRSPATDPYGDPYGSEHTNVSEGSSRFHGPPTDPVTSDYASPYADRYAATDRYSPSGGGRYGDRDDERQASSSAGGRGAPVQPGAATLADLSDTEYDAGDGEHDSDEWEEASAGAATLADIKPSGRDGYGSVSEGVDPHGTDSGVPTGSGRPLSPAAHLENPDENSEDDGDDTSGELYEDSQRADEDQREPADRDGTSEDSGGTSPRYLDDAADDWEDEEDYQNNSDEMGSSPAQANSGVSGYGRPPGPGPSSPSPRTSTSSGGMAGAVDGSAAGGLLGTSTPPRELPPVPPTGLSDRGTSPGSGPNSTAAVPGTRDLEGTQTPSVSIEKFAPQEVQVGQAADFEVMVRNVGRIPAHDVVVVDRVPQGTVLNQTTPEAEQSGDMLIWRLGTLQPGSELSLKMSITPRTEGDIGSVASVTFNAQATARTVSTRPEVVLEVRAAEQVLVGGILPLVIIVRNEGTGAARGVVIEEDVPEGFHHPAGRELENAIGLLRPNETKTLELRLEAQRPGQFRNVVRIRDLGMTDLVHEQEIEIVAPELEVGIQGPRLRYVERQAKYEVTVRNTGTASARRVELWTQLPRGVKFVSADKLGQYDARQHAVYWSLDELPPGKEGTVSLVTLPVSAGEQVIQVEATADLGTADAAELAVRVENLAELSFTISDTADPIEVGSDTLYRIEVVNQGGKADSNVQVSAVLPEELVPTDADGPTTGMVSGQQVQFEPVSRIAPGERLVFQIQARGQRSGDARVRVQLISDEAPKPVVKEESTRVYTD